MSTLGWAAGIGATAVAGVCAGVFLVGGDPPPAKGASPAEMESLRKEVRRLEDRVRALEARRPPAAEPPFAGEPFPAPEAGSPAEGKGPHDASVPGEDPWSEEGRGERRPRRDRRERAGAERAGEGAGEGREGREDRRREWREIQERTRKEYIEALGLNEAQLKSIEAAYAKAREERSALREEVRAGTVKTLDAAPRMREIQVLLDQALQGTLYPDQWKKYQELQAQRRELQLAGGGFGGGLGWGGRDPLAPVPPEGDGPWR